MSTNGDWEWGGCADNVQYGYKKSREFMDSRYRKRSDMNTQVMLHNNEAGRLVSQYENNFRVPSLCHSLDRYINIILFE